MHPKKLLASQWAAAQHYNELINWSGSSYVALSLRRANYGQEWIRTTEGVKP
jgi:hypothetical protein